MRDDTERVGTHIPTGLPVYTDGHSLRAGDDGWLRARIVRADEVKADLTDAAVYRIDRLAARRQR